MSVAHPHCSSFAPSATWLDSAAPTHLLLLPLQPLLVTAVYKIPRGRLALTCFGPRPVPRPAARRGGPGFDRFSPIRCQSSTKSFFDLGPLGGTPHPGSRAIFPSASDREEVLLQNQLPWFTTMTAGYSVDNSKQMISSKSGKTDSLLRGQEGSCFGGFCSLSLLT